ncbi:MAG: hypothetical protein JO040_00355 [Gemmatimonadetes bacterium]|nr:hypothetical protein [Gemmatimonadota bacterium]
MKFTMDILNKDGFVTGPTKVFPNQWVWPDKWLQGEPMEYAVAQSCGNTVNFNVHQDATIIIGLKDLISWVWSSTSGTQDSHDSQPECPSSPTPGGNGSSGGAGTGTDTGHECYYYEEHDLQTGKILYFQWIGCV